MPIPMNGFFSCSTRAQVNYDSNMDPCIHVLTSRKKLRFVQVKQKVIRKNRLRCLRLDNACVGK